MRLFLMLLLIKTAQSAGSIAKIIGGKPVPIKQCPYTCQLSWVCGAACKEYTDEEESSTSESDYTTNSDCTEDSNCTSSNPDNSTPSDYPDYPASDDEEQCDSGLQCGCSIINCNTLLTAAHCVYGLKPHQVRIHCGNATQGEGILCPVEALIVHSDYTKSVKDGVPRNDIAIIKLAICLNFTDTIKAIALAYECEKIGDSCIISGWGSCSEGDYTSMEMNVATVPVCNCNESNYSPYGYIKPSVFCAGLPEGGKDACQGDSGGPCRSKNNGTLMGIISFGYGCGRAGWPGVYVKICYFIKWILQVLKWYSEQYD